MALPLQASFEELGTPLFDVTFCVLDLETTGGSPSDSAITEIGAVKVKAGEVLGTFQTLVNPGTPIPPMITILTGITHSMVIEAPPIEEVFPAFLEFLGTSVVVGHNVGFDLRFLQAETRKLAYPRLENPVADTCRLARRLIRPEVRNLKLSTLASYFRSPVTPNHRALEDAKATAHVFHGLLERAGSLGVTALEDLLTLPTARGASDYRKIELARDLPRAPGVYMFRDRNGTVIYVGKAKNLRTRVTSYFHGDDRRSTADMLRRLDRIDTVLCAGELEALVTEVRMIHAHRPQYNRRSRPSRSNHFVTLTNETFPRFSLTRTIHPTARVTLGPFRSRRSAELVMTALWDATRIRRCSGKPGDRQGRCAPAQMGVSLCPCDGSLDPRVYANVVNETVDAIQDNSSPLADRLLDRMRTLSLAHRFEEAAWVRDRYQALAKAIEKRRRWHFLQEVGRLEAVSTEGEHAVVDGARFVSSWPDGSQRPLLPVESQPEGWTDVPPTNGVAEETDLIWKWLGTHGISIEGGLAVAIEPAMPALARLG